MKKSIKATDIYHAFTKVTLPGVTIVSEQNCCPNTKYMNVNGK